MYASLWGGPTLWYCGAKFVFLPASPAKSLRIILEVRWEPRLSLSVFMICGPGTLECRFISQETEDQLAGLLALFFLTVLQYSGRSCKL
jgi:hypothetical protein